MFLGIEVLFVITSLISEKLFLRSEFSNLINFVSVAGIAANVVALNFLIEFNKFGKLLASLCKIIVDPTVMDV